MPSSFVSRVCLLSLLCATFIGPTQAQRRQASPPAYDPAPQRPKLVVGIVVDQMRYDYLYRYWDQYPEGGIKRLLGEGFSFENAHFDYVPTYTGPGHAAVYTGSVPAINGIVGNNWYMRSYGRSVYVAEDTTQQTVGGQTSAGQMSPHFLLSSTITDELRLFSNRRSKVIGVAIKDRGAILPAGHMPTAAYWYEGKSGRWITSTYYMSALPDWVEKFNGQGLADRYLSKPWQTLLSEDNYMASLAPDSAYTLPYLRRPSLQISNATLDAMPHDLPTLKESLGYALLPRTPMGNSYTTDFAMEAARQEQLGKGDFTDFLAVSYSSTDYVGHQFGVHSREVQDTYLRLDRDLARLLTFLDGHVGKDNVLVFLSADHGAANTPAHMIDVGVPAGVFASKRLENELKEYLQKMYGEGDWLAHYDNQQVYLNHDLIAARAVDLRKMRMQVADFALRYAGVANAFTADEIPLLSAATPQIELIQRGYHRHRCGDVVLLLEPAWYEGSYAAAGGTTHSSGYSYDTHIPIIWYGGMVRPGRSSERVHVTDIAPTLAQILRIMEPNGSIGRPLNEFFVK